VSVGAAECVRLLLLHGADTEVVFPSDQTKTPLSDYCFDRVFNCCDQHFGEQILVIFREFGANFDTTSPTIKRHMEQSEMSTDYTKRYLIRRFVQLAEKPLGESNKRRLGFFKKYKNLRDYKAFIEGSVLKNWDQTMKGMDKKERNRKREEFADFLMFKDPAILPDQIIVK
jgi:hypothetical protein